MCGDCSHHSLWAIPQPGSPFRLRLGRVRGGAHRGGYLRVVARFHIPQDAATIAAEILHFQRPIPFLVSGFDFAAAISARLADGNQNILHGVFDLALVSFQPVSFSASFVWRFHHSTASAGARFNSARSTRPSTFCVRRSALIRVAYQSAAANTASTVCLNMRGCLLFRMRALTLYGSIVLSFCHFRTNKSPPRPRQIKSKSFLPCQRERCAATCAAHEHTELAAKRRLFNREEKKLNAEAEQAAKERAAKAKEYTDQRTSAAKDIRSAEQANYLAGIQDDKKRSEEQARLEKENAIREINAGEYTIKEKNRLKKAAEEKYQLDLTKIALDAEKKRQDELKAFQDKAAQDEQKFIDDAFALEQLKATQTIQNEKDLQAALQQLEIDRLNNQIQSRKDYGQSTTDLELTLANKRIDIAKNEEAQKKDLAQKEFDTKMALYDATSNALGAIGNAIGEETAAAKGLAIAGAIIDTYAGATKALSAGAGCPISTGLCLTRT